MSSTVTRRGLTRSQTVQVHPQVQQIVSLLNEPQNKQPFFTPEQVAEINAEAVGGQCLAAFCLGVISTFILVASAVIIWAWFTK